MFGSFVANTSQVVQNLAANVALAVGASPIMAGYGEEAADLCKLGGALVINMGSVDPSGLENYIKALKAYNLEGRPVVFDPVGYVAHTPIWVREKKLTPAVPVQPLFGVKPSERSWPAATLT